tara:strand:+ start:34130 stop:34366 length:237 start_codon:yes stop_codon:yes gene_type:complete
MGVALIREAYNKIINWCSWCETICFKPYKNQFNELLCRHCLDEALYCDCCEEPIHEDGDYKDMNSGFYCIECYDDIYG